MSGDAEEDANGFGAYGAGVSVCLEQVLVEVASGADAGFVLFERAVGVGHCFEDEFGGEELMTFGVGDSQWSIHPVRDEHPHIDQGLDLFTDGDDPRIEVSTSAGLKHIGWGGGQRNGGDG